MKPTRAIKNFQRAINELGKPQYKVVMLALDPHGDILMGHNLTYRQACERKEECEREDGIHYFEIQKQEEGATL